MKRIVLLVSGFLLGCFIHAQTPVFTQRNDVPVSNLTGKLINAWAGGINSSTFSKFDFDMDGKEDLLILDRQQNRPLVFLAKQNTYQFSPEHASLLPPLVRYALFYDYDKDNKKDLFTATTLGIKLYRNISTSTEIKFKLVANGIPTRYYSNTPFYMSITNQDVPALVDIDRDGDMDILHFDSQTGENVILETNFSIEKYGRPDSLYFGTTNEAWGGFTEVGCTNYLFGKNGKVSYSYRLEHSGAGALTVFDSDGNDFPDLLLGKSDCQNLNYLQNNGNGTLYFYTQLVSSYPIGTPANQIYLPIANYDDYDFDGIKDLVVTMGLPVAVNNTNLRKTAWYYKNTASNTVLNFQLASKDFVQNTMIDLGKNTVPAFADSDGDGDYDLFVSTSSNEIASPSTIYYYENKGNATDPSFQLIDTNYLSLSAKNYITLSIAFTDLNNDGNLDLAYTAQKEAVYETKIYYNQSTVGMQYSASVDLNIPIVETASLCFFDINQDRFNDLLVGDVDGNLRYYINEGNASVPSFRLSSSNYGGLSSSNFNCSAMIYDIEQDGKLDLLVSNDSGYVKVCSDFLRQNPNKFPSYILPLSPFGNQGQHLSLAAIDLYKDHRVDMVIGNAAGGLTLFQFDPLLSGLNNGEKKPIYNEMKVWPNPSEAYMKVELPEAGILKIHDAKGTIIAESEIENASHIYQSQQLKQGFYVLTFTGQSGQTSVQKVIVR